MLARLCASVGELSLTKGNAAAKAARRTGGSPILHDAIATTLPLWLSKLAPQDSVFMCEAMFSRGLNIIRFNKYGD
jgi:hypothetical protein